MLTDSRNVAIVAKAPNCLEGMPWHDPSWQVWSVNDMAFGGKLPRWDVSFEIHDPEYWQGPYGDWMRQPQGKPIITNRFYQDVPDCDPYPLEMILEHFGGRYITCSVAAMVALAITLQPESIGLWGVNCGAQSEWAYERPCIEGYCRWAQAKGIEIVIPAASSLFKSAALYGFERNGPVEMLSARQKELQERLTQARKNEAQAALDRAALEAASYEVSHWQSRFL